jgi:hypothetical protein
MPVQKQLYSGLPLGEQIAEQSRETSSADLQWICRSALSSAFPSFRDMAIEASFYPYLGLTHTIRRKGTKWILRISDHCRRAPASVLEAIAMILASKVMRRRPDAQCLQHYERFRNDPWVSKAVEERRRAKGRKRIASTPGKCYSLRQIFEELNAEFFNGQIELRKIGWGFRRSWRRLGHYDLVHRTVALSPVLDSPKVPKFVVRYIVYHEMLHAVFEGAPCAGRRKHHPPAYNRAEKAYPDYARAKKFLSEFCAKRKA